MANSERLVRTVSFGILIATAAVSVLSRNARGAESVDFDRDVRPILSDKCFKCHGPDEAARQAGLRLDVRDAALAAAESGEIAIVPKSPETSQLVTRILSTDPAEMMPPPEANKPLTEAEKELLRKWVAEGAAYEKHWSFVPIHRPDVPKSPDSGWARNEIDHFVAARLKAAGAEPSPEASREALIRRLTFDLTGLPPTVEEIDAFLTDTSGDAYDKVVNRLLASPHFGERMAVDWLDAARYADTHGYHIDSGRDMTRWREWVIDAFNNNKPFDEFTVEQLAGDLLPNATLDQKIASGFNRNHMINYEGGAIPEEYLAAYIIDRVNTTSTVWLGLTVGCAQCHDHKFDPISQREFYGLYAFFHNVPESGLDGIKGNAAPFLSLPTEEQSAQIAKLKAEISQGNEKLQANRPDLDDAQRLWEQSFSAESPTWIPASIAAGDRQGIATSNDGTSTGLQEDQSLLVSGENPAQDTYTVRFNITKEKPISALRLDALADERLPANGPGRAENGNFVLSNVRIESQPVIEGAPQGTGTPVKIRSVTADFSQDGFPVESLIDADAKTGWAISPETGKSHYAVLELEQPIESGESPIQLAVTLEFQSEFGQHAIGRLRLSYTTAESVRTPDKLPRDIRRILAKSPEDRSDEQRDKLRRHFRSEVSDELRAVAAQVKAQEEELKKVQEAVPTAMVMEELPKPRETFIMVRGQYDKKGQEVTALTPAMLPPLPEGEESNRLGLARWLVAPNHPLTSRVTVNRYWQMFFGRGLVETTEDFGTQGALPTHPDLLDWLAAEFMTGSVENSDRGAWDVKGLVRMIVMSSTYRQSSAVAREQYEGDPENRLLGRGARFRLQAEFIRDQALALGGLLDGRIGGNSVSPYQPAGLWEELMSREDNDRFTAQKYVQSHGADLYRRTMYTFWKRTCPPPTLSTFDAPDRETCTVRRSRTNTPLQALILLNDPTYVEASRKIAEHLLQDDRVDTTRSRLTLAFRMATARVPSDRELTVLESILDSQLADYQNDRKSAEELLAVGESRRDESIDVAELAAWATVCSAILNLDETVTRN
jgi:hypothetical protein